MHDVRCNQGSIPKNIINYINSKKISYGYNYYIDFGNRFFFSILCTAKDYRIIRKVKNRHKYSSNMVFLEITNISPSWN